MEHDGEIGAVVTDMMMPGMTGRQFATRLAARYPRLGVVYVSEWKRSRSKTAVSQPAGSWPGPINGHRKK
jgi:CheY-like chemotaxis protein